MSDNTEIRNKESLGGLITEQNADGSPVQEVIQDGEKKAEISNKESLGGLIQRIMPTGPRLKK